MPFSAIRRPYSSRAATARSGIGATAAWSKNAHRLATGKWARNAVQSMRLPAGGTGGRSYIRWPRIRRLGNPSRRGPADFPRGRPGVCGPTRPRSTCTSGCSGSPSGSARGSGWCRPCSGTSSSRTGTGSPYLLVWIACVFVSILLHELGHAFAARWFGSPARIELFAFGGLASYDAPAAGRVAADADRPGRPGRRVPARRGRSTAATRPPRWRESSDFALRNVHLPDLDQPVLELLNLLPIWPLDGGQVCRELAYMAGARKPDAVGLRRVDGGGRTAGGVGTTRRHRQRAATGWSRTRRSPRACS